MKILQPRRFHPARAFGVLAVLAAFFVYTTQRDRTPRLWKWTGPIFGSTYTVQIVDRRLTERKAAALQREIQVLLDDMNSELSTWLPDSPLSRFNDNPGLAPIEVPSRIAELASLSLELAQASGGAFDPTFAPLFDAWGFGRTGPKRMPSPAEQEEALAQCGHAKLTVLSSNLLQKAHPGLRLVFNAIAPGYAAQTVADLLLSRGFTNLYVDVGGETVVRGANLSGLPWRIGIERPALDAEPGAELEAVLSIREGAVATSGDYRNYLRGPDGALYSHIFDPRTARPATSRVASVTVVANSGAWADALATTLFVMGPDEGLPWLADHTDAEALFVLREGEASFREIMSPGFAARAGYAPAPTAGP